MKGDGVSAPRSPASRIAGRTAGPWRAGFTLLEVLLAIAVIGLLASAIIGASSRLLTERPTSPDDVFWQACQNARKSALQAGRDQRLTFDPKTKTFVVSDGTGPRTLPVPDPAGDLAVDFLPTQGGNSTMLLGGTLVETRTMPYVTFYSDGTCVPFQVQLRFRGGSHVQSIDPWTCARELAHANPNGTTGP